MQAAVAAALGKLGDKRAAGPLGELVGSKRPGVALAALKGLQALHAEELIGVLDEAMEHPDTEVVKQVLYVSFQSEDPSSAARLAAGLSHPAWDVRVRAARLLGEGQADTALPTLTTRLDVETDDLARNAVEEAIRKLRKEA